MQDVRLISLTPLAGNRGRVATTLARSIGDNDLLIMLSGPEGSGKSAILAAVVATLAYGGMRVIRVSNPDESTMGQRELAARILGRPTMGSPAQLVAEAITNLLNTTDDGQVVLVVDDAHTLSDQAMELLLVITSPARRGMRAPQLLLAGRGTYWERPWRDELRMLTDVAEKIILEPLTADDARDFVMDEAKASGGTIADVTPDALTALVRCSSGLNAQMDRIVTAAVALGNTRRATVLTEEIVDAVVTPDTLPQPPSTDAAPLSSGDATSTAPASEVPAPSTYRKLRGGWPAIAALALVVVAGASFALLPALRTQVSSLFGRSAPVAPSAPAPAPTSEATTAPEPPRVTQASQPQPTDAAVAGSAATSTTPDAASTVAGAPPKAPAPAPSVSPLPSVETNSEPSAAARDVGHPPATTAGDRPIVSAPQPVSPVDHAGGTTSPIGGSPGGDQRAATRAAPSDTTTDTQAAAAARRPEVAKPDTPAVPLVAPQASVPTTPGLGQPAAVPLTTTPPIAPLPTAPPPAVVVPVIPPPAATPPMVQPPPASPPAAPTSQEAASLPPAVIAVLLQRGNEKLALGDILSARLYFERAGAAGSEEAAMGAAKTYDPGYLATVDAPGLQANVKRAIDWYRIAAAIHGNSESEAQNRIDALTAAGAR